MGWTHPTTSELDVEIGHEPVVLGIAGDLAGVREAEGGVAGHVQVDAGLDEGGIPGDGGSGDGEGIAAGKGVNAMATSMSGLPSSIL